MGNNVVRQLLDKGERVRALYHKKRLDFKALGCKNTDNLCYLHCDVRDPSSLDKAFENAGGAEIYFIHASALVTIMDTRKSKKALREVNIAGTQNVVDACLKYGVKRLVYVSSCHAIPEQTESPIPESENFDPKTVHGRYPKSKAEAAHLVMDAIKNKGLEAVLVHPTGITGPGDCGNTQMTHMVATFIKKGFPALPKGGYDFVDVRDVAWGIITAADKGKSGECYLLSNKYYSVGQMMGYLAELCDKKPIKRYVPTWLIKCAAPFSECYYKLFKKTPLFTRYSIYTLNSNSNFTHDKATQEFGYLPRGLKESLTDTVKFIKSMHNS